MDHHPWEVSQQVAHSHRVTGSCYLLWGHLHPKLDPEFARDPKVITHQLWKVRHHVSKVRTLEALEDFCAEPVRDSCGRMAEVLSKWLWRQVTATRLIEKRS